MIHLGANTHPRLARTHLVTGDDVDALASVELPASDHRDELRRTIEDLEPVILRLIVREDPHRLQHLVQVVSADLAVVACDEVQQCAAARGQVVRCARRVDHRDHTVVAEDDVAPRSERVQPWRALALGAHDPDEQLWVAAGEREVLARRGAARRTHRPPPKHPVVSAQPGASTATPTRSATKVMGMSRCMVI